MMNVKFFKITKWVVMLEFVASTCDSKFIFSDWVGHPTFGGTQSFGTLEWCEANISIV